MKLTWCHVPLLPSSSELLSPSTQSAGLHFSIPGDQPSLPHSWLPRCLPQASVISHFALPQSVHSPFSLPGKTFPQVPMPPNKIKFPEIKIPKNHTEKKSGDNDKEGVKSTSRDTLRPLTWKLEFWSPGCLTPAFIIVLRQRRRWT